jgi:hypothetical protein
VRRPRGDLSSGPPPGVPRASRTTRAPRTHRTRRARCACRATANHDSPAPPPALGRSRELGSADTETRNRDRLDDGQELQGPGQQRQIMAAIHVAAATHSASTERLRQSTAPAKRARASRSRYLRLPGLSCA